MALQGSFETIALPDVLSLLASSTKSGELRVTDRHAEGCLWFDDGRLVGWDIGLAHSHVDAVFELLRRPKATFAFDDRVDSRITGEPAAVDSVMVEASRRLAEWRIIEAVIPSLEASLKLCPALPGRDVTVTSDQWRLLVSVAEPRSVHDVLNALELGEFDGCRALKELVDAGLVSVGPPVAAPEPVVAGQELARLVRAATAAPPAPTRPARPLGAARQVQQPARPARAASPAASPAATPAAGQPPTRPARPAAVAHQQPRSARMAANSSARVSAQPPVRPRRLGPVDVDQQPRRAPVVAGSGASIEGSTPEFQAGPSDAPRGRRARWMAAQAEDASRAESRAPDDPGLDEVPATAAPAPVATVASSGELPSAPQPDNEAGEEPMNRGLLLKFLSSVRS